MDANDGKCVPVDLGLGCFLRGFASWGEADWDGGSERKFHAKKQKLKGLG